MIKLFNERGQEVQFKITLFPDKTSQVWQISPEPLEMTTMRVLWQFENEAELLHVCQLGMLLSHKYKIFPLLDMPYLAYSRQDKGISNESTFARHMLIDMVKNAGYQRILTYDVHSEHPFILSKQPTDLIAVALPGHDVVCFPDRGAAGRYLINIPADVSTIYCDKKRNQLTGEIEGLELNNTFGNTDVSGKIVLILDDICDGGRTFVEAAKTLYKAGAKNVSLAVSHGIFSKGLDVIYDAGIKNIYTTNSLMKNEVGIHFVGYTNFSNCQVIKIW